jgi:hypothetical protein
VSRQVTLTLPEDLVREAEAIGILTPEVIARLIRDEIDRRRKFDRLFETMDKLSASGEPPLTDEELEAEIQAARAERRRKRGP